jgi:hypothetical protein
MIEQGDVVAAVQATELLGIAICYDGQPMPIMQAMRQWVAESVTSPHPVRRGDVEIVDIIEHCYSGGVRQFIADGLGRCS